jgi:hypothetical protein
LIGPYSEHYVLDLGYTYLGLSVVVVWATVRLSLELSRAAAAAAVVANLPHLLFHLNHTHALSLADNIAQDGLLTASTVAGVALLLLLWVALLLLLWQRPDAAELPSAHVLRRPEGKQPVAAGVGGDGS